MARPAHPSSVDPKLQAILDAGLVGEKLIPCPDVATAKLIRSRLRELVRGHKVWNTDRADLYRTMRFKILQTFLILPLRQNYTADPEKRPFTLVVDSRDMATALLDEAISTTNTIPMTRRPQEARPDSFDAILDFDEDSDLDEDGIDPYEKIANRYLPPTKSE